MPVRHVPCLVATLSAIAVLISVSAAPAHLLLGPEQLVQADSVDIGVPGYSVPSFAMWDADSLPDLIVGEGSGVSPDARIRVYPNAGGPGDPLFEGFTYAQSESADLVVTGGGCLGVFPRVVHWDGDGLKDLLLGLADGHVRIYLNVGEPGAPQFDAGADVETGPSGFKTSIDVGSRATPTVVDWNGDGLKDLVVGALDGKLHVFVNAGSDTVPDFPAEIYAQAGAGDLVVPSGRSSPHILDYDHDGKKDVLSGNTDGRILFYSNVGTDEVPAFSGYSYVEADSAAIDLPGTPRSRPFACDWTGDGFLDLLVGSGDGHVHLFQGIEHEHWASVPGGDGALESVVLMGAYPNPSHAAASIPFVLERPKRVTVSIYDVAGRRVSVLADRVFPSGRNQIRWGGTDEEGKALPSGVYMVRLDAGTESARGKLILLR